MLVFGKEFADCQHFVWQAHSGFCLEWAGNYLDWTPECERHENSASANYCSKYDIDHVVDTVSTGIGFIKAGIQALKALLNVPFYSI